MNKKLLIVSFSLFLILLQSCNILSEKKEISQWRGPNRDGIFPDKNLLDKWPENGPELLWKYEELGAGYSSAAFGDNKVFTLGTIDSTNLLFAFNVKGELLWKKELGRAWMKTYPGARSTPLIYDGKGYVFDGLGVMHCFDMDGNILWKRNLLKEYNAENCMHGVHENLIIDGQKLLCTLGGKETNVLAMDKDSGETIWTNKGLGELNAYCSPNIIEHGGKNYYITMTYNSLLSIDVETGKLAWSKKLTEPKYGIHANVPLYRNGMLFIIEGYSYGAKMFKLAEDGLSAEALWKIDSVDIQMGDAVLIGDNIFASGHTRKLYCIDWNTGEIKFSNNEFGESTVISADNKLFVQTYKGEVAMLQAGSDTFELLGSFKAPGKKPDHYVQPVIHDGKLYVRYNESLHVYDIQKKT